MLRLEHARGLSAVAMTDLRSCIWENTLGKCPFEKCLWESIHTIDFSYPKVSITSLLSRYPKVRITTVLSRYRKVSITTAFSLIFVPESNLHELDLVADDQVKKQENPPLNGR